MSRRDMPSLEMTDATEEIFHSVGDRDELIHKYSRCQICGGNLHFTHYTDFNQNVTQETAKCPECGIRVRRVLHKLQ